MPRKNFIFDFDSTIFPGESLDEIIQFTLKESDQHLEKSKEISKICEQGMSGEIPMATSLKKRLEIAAPTKRTIEKYIETQGARIDKRMTQLLKELQMKGYMVYVVSGGFEEWIKPLLKDAIPIANLHANQIKDLDQAMTFENIFQRDKELLIKKHIPLENETIMIGDGATDFSVFEEGLAQHFVGTFFYTGLEARENIVRKALDSDQNIFSAMDKFIVYMKKTFL